MGRRLSAKSKTYLILFLVAGLVFIFSRRDDIKKWNQRRNRDAKGPMAVNTEASRIDAGTQIENITLFITTMTNRLQRAPLPRATAAHTGSNGDAAAFTPWFVQPLDPEVPEAATNALAGSTESLTPETSATTFPAIAQTYRDHDGHWCAKDQDGNVYADNDIWTAADGSVFRFAAIEAQWIWLSQGTQNIRLPAEYRPAPLRIVSVPPNASQIQFQDVPRPLQQGETLIWNTYRYEIAEIGPNVLRLHVTPPKTHARGPFTLCCIGL